MTSYPVIDDTGRPRSLWVDEHGALLVCRGDTPEALPAGAVLATAVLVNERGELVLSVY